MMIKLITRIPAEQAILFNVPLGPNYIELDLDPLTPEQRRVLSSLVSNHSIDCFVLQRIICPPTKDELLAVVDKEIQKEAKEKEVQKAREEQKKLEYEAQVQDWLNAPKQKWLETARYYGTPHCWSDPRLSELVFQARATVQKEKEEAALQKKEQEEKEEQRRQIEKQKAAENLAQQQAYAYAWTAQHGTASQKERVANNALPIQEIKTEAKKLIFAPLSNFPVFEKISKKGLCKWDTYEDIVFEREVEDEWPADAWEMRKKIHSILPTAKLELYRHAGYCTHEDCLESNQSIVVRYGIMVSIQDGPWTHNKEFAVPEARKANA